LADAKVQVSAGDPRGMCVSVSLPETSRLIDLEVKQALDTYLFESQVQVV
jgi:hypothetical protein